MEWSKPGSPLRAKGVTAFVAVKVNVVFAEDGNKLFDGPALLPHDLPLTVLVQQLRSLSAAVSRSRSVFMAAVMAKIHDRAVLLAQSTPSSAEDMVPIQRIPAPVPATQETSSHLGNFLLSMARLLLLAEALGKFLKILHTADQSRCIRIREADLLNVCIIREVSKRAHLASFVFDIDTS